MPFLLIESWCHNTFHPQKWCLLTHGLSLLVSDLAKIPALHLCVDQTCCPKGGRTNFPKDNKCPQICWSSTGWAFAATAMPAFGSAWDSHRTSDSAGRDLEHQGLSLTRFEIIVGLKRKVCILSLPHFPLAPIQHCLAWVICMLLFQLP